MDLTFLSAAVPLTKTIAFSARDNAYTTSPYPMVSKVTSHTVTVKDMADFARAIVEQGKLGRCLLKGSLDTSLEDESRAGHSVEADHEWVCFDFDKVDCPPTFDGALAAIGKYLPKYLHNVDCVIQLSASCVHPEAKRLSAHVFFKLREPVPTKVLFDWLTWLNFQPPAVDEVRLTDSANSLSLPIDRTVSSPAKLLYIAPPRMIGFASKPETVRFHRAANRDFAIAHFTPISMAEYGAQVNKLRIANSLPERSFSTVMTKGIEVLKDPGEGVIHDIRSSGDGFIRFNLNGGDSLAYFINLKEPHLIGNFKGEPYMYTREVNEQFFKALTKAAQAMPSTQRAGPETEVLAFYATNRGSQMYIGTYDRATDELRVDTSNETAALSWLRQFGVPVKLTLPHYDLTYDPSSDIRYEEGYPVINLYGRTDFIKEFGNIERTIELEDSLIEQVKKEAPTIHKTLASVTGDRRSYLLFLNWLAYIFQTRKKSGTAWLFWGRQGTGKGMLMQHIITPIFGKKSCAQVLMTTVDSSFNTILEGKLVVNIDEAAMTRSRDKIEAMSKIKNWITEPTFVVNTKRVVEYEAESYANFIFTSNDARPIIIDDTDRRFHVGTRQEERLHYSPNEMAILAQGEELPALAKLLGSLKVDDHLVRNPEFTEAKASLFEATHSLVDRVALAISEGDSNFFVEAYPAAAQVAVGAASMLPLREYRDLLRAMHNNTLNALTRNDLYVLFKVVVNDDKQFPENSTAQRQILQRHQLLPPGPKSTVRCKRQGKPIYAAQGPDWQEIREELLPLLDLDKQAAEADDQKVVPMKGKK